MISTYVEADVLLPDVLPDVLLPGFAETVPPLLSPGAEPSPVAAEPGAELPGATITVAALVSEEDDPFIPGP